VASVARAEEMAPNADRTALQSRHASHVTQLVNAQASHSTLNTYHLRNGMEHRAQSSNAKQQTPASSFELWASALTTHPQA